MTFRDQLIEILRANSGKKDLEIRDDTSLIRSGAIDSMALFHLATWIEETLDDEMDFTEIDVTKEWDTPADILSFLECRMDARGKAD